jgi:hypothetical protein
MSGPETYYLAAAVGTIVGSYAFDSVGKGFLCAIGAVVSIVLWRLNGRTT